MNQIDLEKAEVLIELCELALQSENGIAVFNYKGNAFAVVTIK